MENTSRHCKDTILVSKSVAAVGRARCLFTPAPTREGRLSWTFFGSGAVVSLKSACLVDIEPSVIVAQTTPSVSRLATQKTTELP